MTREHYACQVRLDELVSTVCWYSDAVDGLLAEREQIRAWPDLSSMRAQLAHEGISLTSDDVATYDLDALAHALRDGRCPANEMIEAWNFLADLAASVAGCEAFTSYESNELRVYNHVFYLVGTCATEGCDPPPLESWEIEVCEKVLALGASMFRSAVLR